MTAVSKIETLSKLKKKLIRTSFTRGFHRELIMFIPLFVAKIYGFCVFTDVSISKNAYITKNRYTIKIKTIFKRSPSPDTFIDG